MARCPFANWNPVKYCDHLAHMANVRAAFLHTNGGGSHLTSWFDQLWDRDHQRVGSTFQVFSDGKIDQLCETDAVIYAQYSASEWAVSIETEDDGHPSQPWTKAQLDAIVRLLGWLHETHGIPLKLMTSPNDSGIGYHQQFTIYNKSGHDCPGPVRLNQLVHTVLPRLSGQATDTHPTDGDGVHSHIPQPVNALPLPWMQRDPDTKAWQAHMIARGWRGIGTADGVYGDKAQTVCKAFQKEKGLPVTGKVDEKTWVATWTSPIS